MQASMEVSGLKELQAKLEQLKTQDAERIIRKAVRDGAMVEREAIFERAPERLPQRTRTALPIGALARDIVIRSQKDSSDQASALVTFGKATAHVARWVEYGHRLVRGGQAKFDKSGRHIRGAGRHVGDVPPHPFIRPAFEESRQRVVEAIVDGVRTRIERAARKKA